MLLDLAHHDNLTAAQLITHLSGGGHLTIAGTPRRVADVMHEWLNVDAADGFSVMPPTMPGQLQAFINDVLPILRSRGLVRDTYTATTLRGHYQLPTPAGAP